MNTLKLNSNTHTAMNQATKTSGKCLRSRRQLALDSEAALKFLKRHDLARNRSPAEVARGVSIVVATSSRIAAMPGETLDFHAVREFRHTAYFGCDDRAITFGIFNSFYDYVDFNVRCYVEFPLVRATVTHDGTLRFDHIIPRTVGLSRLADTCTGRYDGWKSDFTDPPAAP